MPGDQVSTGAAAEHERLIEQLRRLRVHSLVLALQVPIDSDVQRQWASLVGLAYFDLRVHAPGMTLVALPRCKIRTVRLAGQLGPEAALVMDWRLLASCPGVFRIRSGGVQLVGCPGHAPKFAQPWQLHLLIVFRVQGLTAPLTKRKHELILQNSAADAAGW